MSINFAEILNEFMGIHNIDTTSNNTRTIKNSNKRNKITVNTSKEWKQSNGFSGYHSITPINRNHIKG